MHAVPSAHLRQLTDSGLLQRAGGLDRLDVALAELRAAVRLDPENADPTARQDLMAWLDRLVPENDPRNTHRSEGPDDMPAHIKAALLPVSLSIPIAGGKLSLGTWQGIYLWEHRRRGAERHVVVDVRS